MPVVTVDVGTKPTRLLNRNPKRVVFSVINDSSTVVYIGFDSNVSTTGKRRGVKLDANGGWCEDEYHKGEVWAIAEAPTQVTVVEVSEGE